MKAFPDREGFLRILMLTGQYVVKEGGSVIVAADGFGCVDGHVEHVADGGIILRAVDIQLAADALLRQEIIHGLCMLLQEIVMRRGDMGGRIIAADCFQNLQTRIFQICCFAHIIPCNTG